MQGRTRGWMIALAMVGFIAATSSSYMHFQLVNDPFYTSFCDVNESVSCTQLYQGPYGSVAGVPVALGGVLWFLAGGWQLVDLQRNLRVADIQAVLIRHGGQRPHLR